MNRVSVEIMLEQDGMDGPITIKTGDVHVTANLTGRRLTPEQVETVATTAAAALRRALAIYQGRPT